MNADGASIKYSAYHSNSKNAISSIFTSLFKLLSWIVNTILETTLFFHYISAPNPRSYCCEYLTIPSESIIWTSPLPKSSPLGYVSYWSSVPTGFTFYNDTSIYFPLELEPSLCAWPMSAWFPLVTGFMTGGLSVLLRTFLYTNRSSSEDWGSWTYVDSAHLNLPKRRSIYLLQRVNCSSEFNHSLFNSGSSS